MEFFNQRLLKFLDPPDYVDFYHVDVKHIKSTNVIKGSKNCCLYKLNVNT